MEFTEKVDVRSCQWLIKEIKENKDFLSACVSVGEDSVFKLTAVTKTLNNTDTAHNPFQPRLGALSVNK